MASSNVVLGHRGYGGGMLWNISDTVAPTNSVYYADGVLPFPIAGWTTRNGRSRLFDIDEGEDDSSAAYSMIDDVFRYRLGTGDRFYLYAGKGTADVEVGLVGAGGFT